MSDPRCVILLANCRDAGDACACLSVSVWCVQAGRILYEGLEVREEVLQERKLMRQQITRKAKQRKQDLEVPKTTLIGEHIRIIEHMPIREHHGACRACGGRLCAVLAYCAF